MSQEKFRLVTRSDFDGLVCAVLLNELDLIDDIKFVHPKDMQDGKVEITSRDITPCVVSTPSAFNKSEVPDAGMADSPIISSTGPIIPPATVAAASQRQSPRSRYTFGLRRIWRMSQRPMPEPR